MKDSESLPENKKENQESAMSWDPGVEHLDKGLVLSRDQTKMRIRGDVIGSWE